MVVCIVLALSKQFQLYGNVSDPQLAERLFAVFPKSEAIYVMLVYSDESEAAREVFPAASISALTGTGLQWQNLTTKWERIIKQYEVKDKKDRPVFHTSEFETPEGRINTVYEHWSTTKRESFGRDLLDAIAESSIQAVSPSVIVAEYNEVAARLMIAKTETEPPTTVAQFRNFENKYCFLAMFAMLFAGQEATTYYPKGDQAFYYFESGGGYKGWVEDFYNTVITQPRLAEHFRFGDKPNFVGEDLATALQSADKIAYEVSKHVSHHRDPNPPIQHSEIIAGNRVWKTRYAMKHLNKAGLDIKIPFWRKDELEEFFHLK
jgi:hypothetical protein